MKLLKFLAGVLLLAVLAAILIPALYGLAWMLATILPVVCACVVVGDAWREEGPVKPVEILGKLALAVLVLPLAMMAIAAPLRAILLAVMSFFPEAMARFNEIHGFVYVPLAAAFGDLAPYWMDLYWGAFGAGIIFFIALCGSIRRNRLARQVRILPTAKIRSVAVGLAELKGKAIAMAGNAKGAPIMRSWIESTDDGHSTRTHIDPFYLDDGTGRILVDPRGASINDEGAFFDIDLHQAILKLVKKKAGFPESRLMHGDTVYVVGNVQINRDRDAYPDEEVVVKPCKSSWLSMRFYDLFLVSNISEAALLKGFQGSVARGWCAVFIGMAFGLWLSGFALTNIIQLEASRVEAAPAYLRLISTPTTLEREIDIGELGRHPTIHFVELLEEGDRDKTESIMRRFRDLLLTPLATPTLRVQAADIDSPGFGISNYWLLKLDALPHGHWGVQLFDDKYAARREALVLRLMTRYHDRRLFVSYRAWVDRDRVPGNDRVRNRKVVIALTNEQTGKQHEAVFPADPGFNRIDGTEAFEYLEPGTYEVDAFVKTKYGSGLYDRGSRRRSGVDIRLED
jgi:hypothetical protein